MADRRTPASGRVASPEGDLEEKEREEAANLSPYLSYAVLILYVLASVSSTRDEVLLLPQNGIKLPLVGVGVSVVGFYLLIPLIVLVGHLVTLRRIPQTFSMLSRRIPRDRHERLIASSDEIMFISLLLAGPATLLFITCRFADYQSPIHFIIQSASLAYACYAAMVSHQQVMNVLKRPIKWLLSFGAFVFCSWFVLASDVILAPASHSIALRLKANTNILDSQDGGTVPWVPHIHIDRATRIWEGDTKGNDYLAVHTGYKDAKERFLVREVALDLRSRNLRFLDLSHQVIPRIWAHDADMSGANFSFSRIYGSVFVGTKIDGAKFWLASLDGATFMNMKVNHVVFQDTMLKGSYWDNVSINNSAILSSNLLLSSFYGVAFNGVMVVNSNLSAISLYESRANDLAIASELTNYILTGKNSEEVISAAFPALEISPKRAISSIIEDLCQKNIHISMEYAWATFAGLKTLMTKAEQEVVGEINDMMDMDQCRMVKERSDRYFK